jgi:hypothetical protein
MDAWLDLLQWPAMVVTVLALLVASRSLPLTQDRLYAFC